MLSACRPPVSGYLIVKVLKLVDDIIEEVERCVTRPLSINLSIFIKGPRPPSMVAFWERVECHLLGRWAEEGGGWLEWGGQGGKEVMGPYQVLFRTKNKVFHCHLLV
jgi:hypothetical protein